jgi:hypothetical protein
MINVTLVAYVFAPLESITKNDKTFHVLKVKYYPGKEQKPVYVEAYISDGQFKYASLAKPGDTVVLVGDLSVSAYINKENQPKARLSLFVKSQKLISKEAKEEKQEQEIAW